MVARIIEFCARSRFLVLLGVAIAAAASIWSIRHVNLDAIPDLGDPQVIVFTEWMGRSPDLVEDQITYPIVTRLVGAPHVTAVRGQSMFGMSFVNVIFDDGTDLYWGRSRVLEYLSSIQAKLPGGVTPVIGPDATGVGWVFEYALVDRTGKHGLQELQSLQDWNLRYALQSVPGVAEVASVGGFTKEYQIDLDPNRLQQFGVSLMDVMDAVKRSNNDVGGRVLEISGTEHFIRGRGYVTRPAELEKAVLDQARAHDPLALKRPTVPTPLRMRPICIAGFQSPLVFRPSFLVVPLREEGLGEVPVGLHIVRIAGQHLAVQGNCLSGLLKGEQESRQVDARRHMLRINLDEMAVDSSSFIEPVSFPHGVGHIVPGIRETRLIFNGTAVTCNGFVPFPHGPTAVPPIVPSFRVLHIKGQGTVVSR